MSWKIAFALFAVPAGLSALSGGCGTDVCTRADDQVAACAPPTETLPTVSMNANTACTPRRACQAECINSASCAQINDALCIGQTGCRPLQGTPSPFVDCMNACGSD
jgi:hypothetical protein